MTDHIVTILWILACAAYMPADYHLVFPALGLIMEARKIWHSKS